MDKNSLPIGVFDSGLGGLTITKAISKVLPQESIVYIGDTARVPYGNRSREVIISFSHEIIEKLKTFPVKAIVVACGTASAVALDILKKENPDIPILGIINISANAAMTLTKTGHIGIIATRTTINSKIFEQVLNHTNPNLHTYSQACPLFVPMIEEGIVKGTVTEKIIQHYLDPLISKFNIDTLILGCTHYPLIAQEIEKIYPHLKLVLPGKYVGESLKKTLSKLHLLTNNSSPIYQFYATDITTITNALVQEFFGDYHQIKKINL